MPSQPLQPLQPSLLVVDDDVGMVDTLADIFAAHDCRVETARSGDAAVDAVRKRPYDMVLMDIQMPGINGVEALKLMKAHTPAVRVVLMTAFTRHELVDEGLRASALAVMSKPLDIDRVLRLVRSAWREDPTAAG